MSFFRTIREGIQYMDAFPEDILLNPVFPEYRVKRCMKFARILLPPFIILILVYFNKIFKDLNLNISCFLIIKLHLAQCLPTVKPIS